LVYGDRDEAKRLFGDLRFLLIDEVPPFMESDRGLQLLCCLERLQRVTGVCARRIGLSATLSDLSTAESWLSASTGVPTVSEVCPAEQNRQVRILYSRIPGEDIDTNSAARKLAVGRMYMRMFHETEGRSSIVFVNSRRTAERTGRSLTKMAERMGSKMRVFVHHGSVSKESRKAAEEYLKGGHSDVTTVATSTLELGVDIGSLDTVVQIGPPHSCSSLLQRMGRSGRRGGSQSLVLFCNDDAQMWWSDIFGVSVNLIRSIAMVELAVKEGWVEPPDIARRPYGILLQQTLAYLRNSVGARFTELCDEVLSLYPFRDIPVDDYRMLVKHMVARERLTYLNDSTRVLGPQGERIAFGKGFPVVFAGSKDIEIRFDGKPIGTVQKIPEIGGNILLSGRVWAIKSVSPDGSIADVVESEGDTDTSWKSGAPEYHRNVLRKMREVLMSDEQYDYVDEDGLRRLNESRKAAREAGMDRLMSSVDDFTRITPWIGSRQYDTMYRMLRAMPGISVIRHLEPYIIDFRDDGTYSNIMSSLKQYSHNFDLVELVTYKDDLIIGKYDDLVPEALLMKEFAADRLDANFDTK
jgi:ATP-dependent Lhr-like helicase